ncbi:MULTISPECIES: ABC transporter substrate-binding protein [Pseudomonas]|uniref:Amino acid ABC transporter substrate-binding protein n=1 Tax=Pseudomonas kuykendallii TaxID=1007099 RepID=A0A2W5D647_9PSED|nr:MULTISPECIES: ABC transporter substrate-binding protein [Pseudomonas]MCQ4271410.1 ABC transporter substrate-binding protein [Pseudomonas kuykendallii]PZP25743.1 MAG: amino acid ABC transporter substrate-binding protein [Pseudomonas kuykendallii]SDX18297.1 amino acid ABC transporter substrate-binding protein, PAAT family [Pseudomonas kuykendallii]
MNALLKYAACAALAVPALIGTVQADTLKVGATPTAVPFNYLDTQSNSLQGVMIDIAQALGQKLGFTPELQAIPFAGLVPSLQTQKIDLISSAFAINPARAKVVDFSDELFAYSEEVVYRGDGTYKSAADFAGKVVGVQTGTVMVEPMQAAKGLKELRMYESMSDMIREVALGRLDAAIGDGPVMRYTVKQSGAKDLHVAEDYQKQIRIAIGIAVRKGNADLLARVNKGIAELKADGTLDGILKKWEITP